MAEALYRKYRPQVFEDVVGQEPIERTLKNAIEQDKVSHAYLFTGPRGTGKTTTARLLAKALMCINGPTPDPDGTCEDCRLVAEGVHPDVYELDAASRTGVENVREEIISRVQFAPTRGRYKVYIIDEVHMLSTAAFNALLKTLEEPPSHVVFILCTTDPQKVPETIHSRCQRFDFRRIAPESMVSRLGAICMAEGVAFEGEALDLIAHRAEGGLRNALTSLEQIIAFENGQVTLAGAERLLGAIDSNDLAEIVVYIGKRDIASCFRWTANYVETGADLAHFVQDMAEHIRNLYVLAIVGDDVELDVSDMMRRQLTAELQWYGPDRLSRLLGVLVDLTAELKTTSNPRLAFEIALTRMVRPDSDFTLEALTERVEALESGYSAVAHVLPGEMAVSPAASGNGTYRESSAQPQQSPSGQSSDAVRASGVRDEPLASQPQPTREEAVSSRPPTRENDVVTPFVPAESGDAQQQGGAAARAVGAAGTAGAQGTASLQNSATLQRIWQATLAALRKHKQAYGVLFMGAKASYDSDSDSVRVNFPEESAFAYNAVQKPDVQNCLAEAFQKAAGFPVPFYYEKGASRVAGAERQQVMGAERQQAPALEPRDAGRTSQLQPSPATDSVVQQPAESTVQQNGASQVAREAGPAQVSQAEQEVQPAQAFQPAQASQSEQAAQLAQEPQPAQVPEAVQAAQSAQASQPARASQPEQAVQQVQAPQSAQASQSVQTPQPTHAPGPDEWPPYEPVPYDDGAFYEPVPYDEFDMPSSAAPAERMDTRVPDSRTEASPADVGLTPEGNRVEDSADVQALLQAGFGGGVVFSEVEE